MLSCTLLTVHAKFRKAHLMLVTNTMLLYANISICCSIDNDFRFEKGIEKLLNCEVHAFDPR
jgi:hypothetical protein